MGFYIRKSLRVGPFRFNFSKSGVGISSGIRGLRLGTGPRGNYVHMGRGGVYYRKTFGHATAHRGSRSRVPTTPQRPAPEVIHDGLTDIPTSSAVKLVDSSSTDLLHELNTARKRWVLWPLAASATGLALCVLWAQAFNIWALGLAAFVGAVATGFLAYKDQLRKAVVLYFDLDANAETLFQGLHDAFTVLANTKKAWRIEASGRVLDKKYHAGAYALIRRKSVSLSTGRPPYVKTNISVPVLPAGVQRLYFFPDRILVYDKGGVGAVPYEALAVSTTPGRFIEYESVPKDSQVVGRTWQYVNKDGGPDRRFKNNKALPIALYEELRLSSQSGLNLLYNFSRPGAGGSFRQAVGKLAATHRSASA